MEYIIEHKKLGVRAVIKPLKQRDLEAFGAALSETPSESASQRRSGNVRAAIQAGWFSEITPPLTIEDIPDQLPVVIKLLGDFIDRVYSEVTTIPPE